jgi:hypothetical protein
VPDTVRFSIRQFVIASAVLASWQILGGGNPALADYMSATCLSRGSEVPSAFLFGSGGWEHECAGGAGSSDAYKKEKQSRDRERTNALAPFIGLFQISWHFGGAGNTCSSSGSSSVNGPSGAQVGMFSHVELSGNDAVSLLPPETEITHSFSVTSRLFRPPRFGS